MSPAYATPFADRASAGRLLAVELAKLQSDRPIVHALPRGGVAVAVPIAVAKTGIGARAAGVQQRSPST